MDILVLIQEVKKRPLLWNNTVPGYNEQKSAKVKLWDDICGILDTDLKEKSYVERQYLRRQIQRRWKSLRDCFFRELGKMKRLNSCDALTLYKPYRYFKNLGFLLDVVEKKNSPFPSNNLHQIHYAIKTENDYKLSYDESLNVETNSEEQEERVNEKHDGIAKEENSYVHDCKPPVLVNCLSNLKVKFQGDQNFNTGKNLIKISKDIENNAKQSGLNINPNDSNTDKESNLKIGLISSSKVKVLPIKIVKSVLKTTSGITTTKHATGIKIISPADVKVISPLNQSFKPSQKLSSNENHQNICNVVKVIPAEQNINLDEISNNIEKNPSFVEKLNLTEVEGDKHINYVKENALSDKIILQNKKFNIGQLVRKRLQANRKKMNQLSKKINKKQKNKLNKDEDRMFFLSLIKEFKKIPEEFKFDVKLEIMQILKRGQTYRETIYNNNCSSENSVCSYQSSHVGANVTVSSLPQPSD